MSRERGEMERTINEGVDKKHRSNTPASVWRFRERDKTNDEQENSEDCKTIDVKCSSSSVRHEEPGANGAYCAKCVLRCKLDSISLIKSKH